MALEFYWYAISAYVSLEGEKKQEGADLIKQEYTALFDTFSGRLDQHNPHALKLLNACESLRSDLFSLITTVQQVKEHSERTPHLRELIPQKNLKEFPPTPLPLDPTIIAIGIEADKCSVFKSALSPLKLTFKVSKECENVNI